MVEIKNSMKPIGFTGKLLGVLLVLSIAGSCKHEDDNSILLVTGEAGNIGICSAVIYGTVEGVDYHNESSIGFILSTAEHPSADNGKIIPVKKKWNEDQFSVTLSTLSPTTTYYYTAFCEYEGRYYEGEPGSFTTMSAIVDLGLSVKWGGYNLYDEINANYVQSKPREAEQCGQYYPWGELEAKHTQLVSGGHTQQWYGTLYNWDYYKYSDGAEMTKYNGSDQKYQLDAVDDVATQALGENWRLPTREEWEELSSLCLWERIVSNGVYGFKVSSRTNSNSIFLPFCGYAYVNTSWATEPDPSGQWGDRNSVVHDGINGYYWSSTLTTEDCKKAWAFQLNFNDQKHFTTQFDRCLGLQVRPVYDPR